MAVPQSVRGVPNSSPAPSSTIPTPSTAGIPHTSAPAAAATGTAIGAAAGAAAGAIAGPPGIIAGAVLGAIAGGITAEALVENDEADEALNEGLDEEIGVIGGDLGAAQTKIPARRGTFSLSSAGVGSPESVNEDGGAGVVGTGEGED